MYFIYGSTSSNLNYGMSSLDSSIENTKIFFHFSSPEPSLGPNSTGARPPAVDPEVLWETSLPNIPFDPGGSFGNSTSLPRASKIPGNTLF